MNRLKWKETLKSCVSMHLLVRHKFGGGKRGGALRKQAEDLGKGKIVACVALCTRSIPLPLECHSPPLPHTFRIFATFWL